MKELQFKNKEVLTLREAAQYMGVSESHVYFLTSSRKIPHFKSPTGKMIYFNREELIKWLQSCRVATNEELEQRANNH
jgi:excisionase family DNA binding protein